MFSFINIQPDVKREIDSRQIKFNLDNGGYELERRCWEDAVSVWKEQYD